jgi:hypothetical protein
MNLSEVTQLINSGDCQCLITGALTEDVKQVAKTCAVSIVSNNPDDVVAVNSYLNNLSSDAPEKKNIAFYNVDFDSFNSNLDDHHKNRRTVAVKTGIS